MKVGCLSSSKLFSLKLVSWYPTLYIFFRTGSSNNSTITAWSYVINNYYARLLPLGTRKNVFMQMLLFL